jgi:hypothetical protein
MSMTPEQIAREAVEWGGLKPVSEEVLARKIKEANRQLRAAAERVCAFDWSDNDADAVKAIEALRAALSS